MTPSEVALLLGHAATIERTPAPEEASVLAWHHHLANIRFEDAFAALNEHYAEESRRLMPADILRRVADMRQQWYWAHGGQPEPPGLGRELAIPAYIERERIRALEAGQ